MTAALPLEGPALVPAPAPQEPALEVPVPWHVAYLPPPGMGIFFLILLALYALQVYQSR